MFEVILSCMSSHFELHREVKRGNTCRVREILKSGAVINAKDRSGFTPLMHALRSPMASGELVELLLDSGGEVAETTLDGTDCCLASVAIGGGNPIKLAIVLDRGADPHYMRKHGSQQAFLIRARERERAGFIPPAFTRAKIA